MHHHRRVWVMKKTLKLIVILIASCDFEVIYIRGRQHDVTQFMTPFLQRSAFLYQGFINVVTKTLTPPHRPVVVI